MHNSQCCARREPPQKMVEKSSFFASAAGFFPDISLSVPLTGEAIASRRSLAGEAI